MKCLHCGQGILEGVSLFRQNETGQKGVWACREHNEKPIDSQVDEIVSLIEGK